MELKVGDKVVEDDGIVTIVYEIVRVLGRKSIGMTDFEGRPYFTAYRTKYRNPNHIRTYYKVSGDYTKRRLGD